MLIGTVVVTHNRFEYTLKTLGSLMETNPGGTVLVVDNDSKDGTKEWLRDNVPSSLLLSRNIFPGAATNLGWQKLLKHVPGITHLMRSDNDIEYLPGWRSEVERCFEAMPDLGQLGILNMHEDYNDLQPVDLDETGVVNLHRIHVGGNCVIPRSLWDDGLRWIPGAWSVGANEDTNLSIDIRERGLTIGTVVPTVANNMSFHKYEDYPDYYNFTGTIRGLVPELSV